MTIEEKQIQVLQTIKESVDAYAIAFDPCNMCEYKENGSHNIDTCTTCCYYYASKFRTKLPKKRSETQKE